MGGLQAGDYQPLKGLENGGRNIGFSNGICGRVVSGCRVCGPGDTHKVRSTGFTQEKSTSGQKTCKEKTSYHTLVLILKG